MTLIQTKKNQLAEYDIVVMLAENLVKVGYVWMSGGSIQDFIKK
jgi:hypothetical protein